MVIKCVPKGNNIYNVYFSIELLEEDGEFNYNLFLANKDLEDFTEEDLQKLSYDIMNNDFQRELIDKDLPCLSVFETQFFNNTNKYLPIMGVNKVFIIPNDFSLSVPKEIDSKFIKELDDKLNKVDEEFKNTLIKLKFYSQEPANKVTQYSQIIYDLHYLSDGVEINTITNQFFDLLEDDDMDKNLFVGKQIGDFVKIDSDNLNKTNSSKDNIETDNNETDNNETDNIEIKAEIKSIIDRIPYNKDTIIGKLKEFKYSDYDTMYNDFVLSYKNYLKVNSLFDLILDNVIKQSKLEIPNELKEMFINKGSSKDNVINDIYFDIMKTLVRKTEIPLHEFLEISNMVNDLKFYHITFLVSSTDEKNYLMKKRILKHLISLGVLKGMDIN